MEFEKTFEIECKKCGNTKGYLRVGNVHTGLYCSQCNNWIKWVSKNEVEILNNENVIVDDIVEETVTIEDLEKQRNELNKQIRAYYEKQTEKEITKNNKFIGKTYKRTLTEEMVGYYKILNVDTDNQYRMKTLVFTLPIKSVINKNLYEETSLLDIDSIGWFCNAISHYSQHEREIDLYTEISNEEYNNAFERWLKCVKEIINNV